MRDPYPPVSEDTRDYVEALMDLTTQSDGVIEEFLAIDADPEWECKAYYSSVTLTATIRPAKGEIWQRGECRLTPSQFVHVVRVARTCGLTVRQVIQVRLAASAYGLK